MTARYPLLEGMTRLVNSDAHYLHQIPDAGPWLELEDEAVRREGLTAAVIAALDGQASCHTGRG